MKPAHFEYHAPAELAEVLALLARYGEEARVLAGGQSLVPMLNMRLLKPAHLIDLGHCAGLDQVTCKGSHIEIGAMVRQIAAEESTLIQTRCPLLFKTLPLLGGTANRNRGTICGSLAHADRLAELPATALALDTEFELTSVDGSRRVAAADFFRGDFETALTATDMLTRIAIPTHPEPTRSTFLEVGNRRHGFALVGIAAQLTLDDQHTIQGARLAAMGVTDRPIRLLEVEQLLAGTHLDAAAIEAAARTS